MCGLIQCKYMENITITLNQASFVWKMLKEDPVISAEFDIELEGVWRELMDLTPKKYKYLLALLYNKKYEDLRELLKSINLQHYGKRKSYFGEK